MSDVTKDDLRDVRDNIMSQMKTGFDGTHARLDKVNGRLDKHETVISDHALKLALGSGGWKRDASMIGAGASASAGVMYFVLKLMGFVP